MSKSVPEYVDRLAMAMELNPEAFPKGEVSHPEIKHDLWCALLNHRGGCNCEAEVFIVHRGCKLRVTPKGNLVRVG